MELTAPAWRGYRQGLFPQAAWSVDGDVLRAMAAGERVDLISRDRFGDFVFTFDWRLPRAGSSAVAYRVNEDLGPALHSGPAMQLLDDEHHPEGADALTSCGALYGLMAPWREQRGSAHTYHSARIVAQGMRIEHWIDEVRVLACELDSEDVRERIVRSRFRDFTGFARAPAGHIVLQHRGTEAWFRRLRIEIA